MADPIDQLEDQIDRVTRIRNRSQTPPTRSQYKFAYTVIVDGTRHDIVVLDTTITDGVEYVEAALGVDLSNRGGEGSVQWGRGYIAHGGNVVIHPVTDKETHDYIQAMVKGMRPALARRR